MDTKKIFQRILKKKKINPQTNKQTKSKREREREREKRDSEIIIK